jgi:hypothetical protein
MTFIRPEFVTKSSYAFGFPHQCGQCPGQAVGSIEQHERSRGKPGAVAVYVWNTWARSVDFEVRVLGATRKVCDDFSAVGFETYDGRFDLRAVASDFELAIDEGGW